MDPFNSVVHREDAGFAIQITGGRYRGHASTSLDSCHKFEAYLIQTMVEQMLPKQTDSAFGSGFSGNTWRSMMAERIANVVAEHGGFGVAAQMEQGRHTAVRS